jgi:hypothetical protein
MNLHAHRQPLVRLVERGRVREQPGDGERVGGLHEQGAHPASASTRSRFTRRSIDSSVK